MDSTWGAEIIETPRDGSCFFTAIAIAMNDAVDMWCAIDELRTPMEKYWDLYHENTSESLTEVTADLVRFMCSQNIDQDILVMFNEEANFMRTTQKIKTKIFETEEQLGKHMRKKSTWGDQAALRAFLKSLNLECGVIIFDDKVGGMIRLPEEWTKDKKAYICLRREVDHYNVIRFWKSVNEETFALPLCMTREAMVELLRTVYGIEELDGIREIPVI